VRSSEKDENVIPKTTKPRRFGRGPR